MTHVRRGIFDPECWYVVDAQPGQPTRWLQGPFEQKAEAERALSWSQRDTALERHRNRRELALFPGER